MVPISALVVDDEPSVLAVFQRLFAKMGYACETVATGEEALAKIRAKKYDLFILDKNMPVTGDAIARTARMTHPDSVIILITAHGSLGSAVELVGVADEYLSKPFELDYIRETVTALLARQQQRAASRPSPVPSVKAGQKRVQVVTDVPAELDQLAKICDHLNAAWSPSLALSEDPEVLVVAGTLATFELRKQVWAWQARRRSAQVVAIVEPRSMADAAAAVALKAAFRLMRPVDIANTHAVMQRVLTGT